MKPVLITIGVLVGLFLLFAFLTTANFACGAVDNASTVAKKELYPDALLRKYEWFKTASAQAEAKLADLTVYENRLTALKNEYNGVARKDWHRDDREQYNIWQSEMAGIKASYNSLAAEYNAQMAKFNYRFTNVGDMPDGSTNPLPREFKPYVTE